MNMGEAELPSRRECENCLYCDVSLFDEPCVSCLIENNSNWEAMESYD